MPRRDQSQHLGEPDLKLGGLQLWVHGLENPGAEDPSDLDWLRATVRCDAEGASVHVHGAFLTAADISGFGRRCRALHDGMLATATLEPYEPALRIDLRRVDRLGHFVAQVDITPDHLAQSHRFEFELDQTDLPGLARGCSAIVARLPRRDSGDGKPACVSEAASIVPCADVDQPGWLQLRRMLWPQDTAEAHRAEMATLLARSESRCQFVACDGEGRAIGLVEASIRTDFVNGTTTSPVAFVEGLIVATEFRRRGHARALVAAVEGWARRRGLTELALDALLGDKASLDVHRALGFEETERVVYFRKGLAHEP